MIIKATVMTAAAVLALSSTAAKADTQGILACQISLSQFAEDVYASKARLRPDQLTAARQVVDVGRSQCRSGAQLVTTNVRSMRQALRLDEGRRTGSQFDDFWPADQQEQALLSE